MANENIVTGFMGNIQGIQGGGKADVTSGVKLDAQQYSQTVIALQEYSNTYNICSEANLAHTWYLQNTVMGGGNAGAALVNKQTQEQMENILKGSGNETQKIDDAYKAMEKDPNWEKIKTTVGADKSEISKNFNQMTNATVSACAKGKEQLCASQELKNKVAAITKNDSKLGTLGITDQVILCIVKKESTCNPNAFNSTSGGNGAQGLMQIRNSVIEQLAENRVLAEWAAKGKPENRLNQVELQQLRKEIKAAKTQDKEKIMREGLILKDGRSKDSKKLNDYEAIPGKGLFDADTNLGYGVGHLKYLVEKHGSLEEGIKKYHGNSDEINQSYYNAIKNCMGS